MSIENARNHLKKYGKDGDIIEFSSSSATVKEAAADAARRMVANGSVPLPQIAEFSGLSLGEVESIRRSIDNGSVGVPSCTSRSPSVDSPSP